MRIHALENVQRAIDFLHEKKVPMENIGNHDIVDGNHRIILGLIWTIILRFQVNYRFWNFFYFSNDLDSWPCLWPHQPGSILAIWPFFRFFHSFRPKMAHIIYDLWRYLFRWTDIFQFYIVKMTWLYLTHHDLIWSGIIQVFVSEYVSSFSINFEFWVEKFLTLKWPNFLSR